MVELVVPDVELAPLQVVTPEGEPTASRPGQLADLDARLPQLYELMVLTRELDEEFVNLQRQGQLALYPPCRGQEAAQVGCVAALRETDWMFPQYRELGAFVVRGVDPADIGLAWRGTWHGGLGLPDRCIAPMSIPIGTQALHAVGAAMASSWLDDGGVTVAFIGDGATSEGDVHEALNLAAVQDAPCIFFVQNNGWAISTPLSAQCRAPSLAQRAAGYGMHGVRIDGNDVAASLIAVAEAAERARTGDGPTLVEAVTYRLGPHTTSDDPSRYRTDEEVALWAHRDPIARCRRYLQGRGLWDDTIEACARRRAEEARRALRDAVVGAADPSVSEVFDHVYATPTDALRAQRDELADELSPGS
jgi:2-oxoisovalerate dehydrogenase E1 component subunit alpha